MLSRSVQEADKERIDDLGLLIFLGWINHVVFDIHRFWKIHGIEFE